MLKVLKIVVEESYASAIRGREQEWLKHRLWGQTQLYLNPGSTEMTIIFKSCCNDSRYLEVLFLSSVHQNLGSYLICYEEAQISQIFVI